LEAMNWSHPSSLGIGFMSRFPLKLLVDNTIRDLGKLEVEEVLKVT
jgi:hypothetical protein